jgi:hypothetical protein
LHIIEAVAHVLVGIFEICKTATDTSVEYGEVINMLAASQVKRASLGDLGITDVFRWNPVPKINFLVE